MLQEFLFPQQEIIDNKWHNRLQVDDATMIVVYLTCVRAILRQHHWFQIEMAQ